MVSTNYIKKIAKPTAGKVNINCRDRCTPRKPAFSKRELWRERPRSTQSFNLWDTHTRYMSPEGNPRRRSLRSKSVLSNGACGKNGVHGLVGLEMTALRKSFNGGTKYDFDKFIADSIPEQYAIKVLNDEKELDEYLDCRELREYNQEGADFSFKEMAEQLKGKFQTNLVEHPRDKPLVKIYKVSDSDALDDSLYSVTNEKLAKREKRYMAADKVRLLTEVDDCIEVLSLLGIDIRKGNMKSVLSSYIVEDNELSDEQLFRLSHLLGTITKINDPLDTHEMILKYRLTVREIRSFLLRYIKIKTLETLLKKEMNYLGTTELYSEPTTEQDIEALKEKRLRYRDQRIGKVVKVKFKEGVELNIDPISSPTVSVRDTKKPRWEMKHT